MDNDTKRMFLFLFGCMGSRLTITWLAYKYPALLLRPLGIMALLIAGGFAYIYINGLRKTGIETFGERIWWNELRPVHAVLWGTFAYMALNNMQANAWKVLLVDVIIGFTAWILKNYGA